MAKIVRLTENDLTRLVRKVINEGNKSDFKKYEKIIDNYSNELDAVDWDDENLSEIFKELEELQEKIYKNSELSKKEIKKLDDEIEYLMDYITDVLDSY